MNFIKPIVLLMAVTSGMSVFAEEPTSGFYIMKEGDKFTKIIK